MWPLAFGSSDSSYVESCEDVFAITVKYLHIRLGILPCARQSQTSMIGRKHLPGNCNRLVECQARGLVKIIRQSDVKRSLTKAKAIPLEKIEMLAYFA